MKLSEIELKIIYFKKNEEKINKKGTAAGAVERSFGPGAN